MNYVEQLAADIHVAVHGCPMPDSERLLYLFYAGLGLAVGTAVTSEQVPADVRPRGRPAPRHRQPSPRVRGDDHSAR